MSEAPGIYRERAYLVAYLATRYPSVLSYADPNEPEWPLVFVDTPAGQLSWHIAPEDLELFAALPIVEPYDARAIWDGHDAVEKYERLMRLAGSLITNEGAS